MPDILNRVSDAYGGSFSADGAFISFSSPLVAAGGGAGLIGEIIPGAGGAAQGVGLLTQSIGINYMQNILRIYEIGTNFHFFVAGRTQGTMQAQRILGPRPVSIAFYRSFGDVCNVARNIINLFMATGCSAQGATPSGEFQSVGASFNLSVKFCVINALGIAMNVQDSMINESLGMMFCSLELAPTRTDVSRQAAIDAAAALVDGANGLINTTASALGAIGGASGVAATAAANLAAQEAIAAINSGAATAGSISNFLIGVLGTLGSSGIAGLSAVAPAGGGEPSTIGAVINSVAATLNLSTGLSWLRSMGSALEAGASARAITTAIDAALGTDLTSALGGSMTPAATPLVGGVVSAASVLR